MRNGTLSLVLTAFFAVLSISCDAPPGVESPSLPTANAETADDIGAIVEATVIVPEDKATDEGVSAEITPNTGPILLPTINPAGTPLISDNRTHRSEMAVLPAPLYYLRTDTGQVARLSADGITLTSVTDEPFPISDFDIQGNLLVFVSNNELIEIDLATDERLIRVVGEKLPREDERYWLTRINSPRISPTGDAIVFTHQGLFMISPDTDGQVRTLLAQPPLPDFSDPVPVFPEEPIRFFNGADWSPNGERLNLSFGYFPEAGGVGIYDLADGTFQDVSMSITEGAQCCDFSWGLGGRAYIASDLSIYGTPGLTQISGDGTSHSLALPSDIPEAPQTIFRAAHEKSDGELLVLGGERLNFDSQPYFQVQSVSPDGQLTTFHSLPQVAPGETILWAEDSSGLLVEDIAFGRNSESHGTMRWISLSGGSIELPVTGTHFTWGELLPGDDQAAEPDITQLLSIARADFGIRTDAGTDDVYVRRLVESEHTLFVAHTGGLHSFSEDGSDHQLAIYQWDAENWTRLANVNLSTLVAIDSETSGGPEYLTSGTVEQGFIEPDNLWLTVKGGVGAHSGLLQLLRFDGSQLHLEASGFSASPNAGWLEDLDGDGWQELILDNSDPYVVFCYACGVRLIDYTIMRWVDGEMEAVMLNRLEDDVSAEIRAANDLAVDLASVHLYDEAERTAAVLFQSGNEDAYWNAKQISLVSQGRASALNSSWPLISLMFHGDYDRVSSVFLAYSPEQILDPGGPLIAGTVAEGWLDTTLPYIINWTSQTISYREEAGAYFLRGWAKYLLNARDNSAIVDIQRSAELQPENAVYPVVAAWLSSE